MKTVRIFLGLMTAVLVFSTLGAAQKKSHALAENASLEETQKWLVKAIRKHQSFKGSDVLDIKFEGCQLSYKIARRSFFEPFNSPQLPDTTNFMPANLGLIPSVAGNPARDLPMGAHTFFDLREMDADKIQLENLKNTKKVQIISLASLNKRKAVRHGTGKKVWRERESVQILVKTKAAESIKSAFAQAISLCQVTK